jgi:hypothetical protein
MRLASFRTVVAFLAAPWAPAAILAMLIGEYAFSDDWWAVVIVAAAFGYVGIVFIGVPAAYFLARRGTLNLVALAVAGALGGIPVFGVFVVVVDRLANNPPEWPYSLWGAPFGLVVALAFGVIAGVPARTHTTAS